MDYSTQLLQNIEILDKKFGGRLTTNKKWIVAYWQKIDNIEVTDGNIAVNDIINRATNPSHILESLNMYRTMKQMG